VYFEEAKQSITSDSIIPDTVLLDSRMLKSLPLYQRKATMCDALCHAMESFWSVNSTDESRFFSRDAIRLILDNMDGYLNNTDEGNKGMLLAAHTAGKAINITQTTAGHAMCYKITSLFNVAHGHAAILCDRVLYSWMMDNTDKCIDPRGEEYLREILDEIGMALGCGEGKAGAEKLNDIFEHLCLDIPVADAGQYKVLVNSVNPVRLKNHPVLLDEDSIEQLYHKILGETS
jgi:alcohol dehydrogenase class IV